MTLTINGKTYEADELVAYVEKLEKENHYYKDMVETNSAEWEEQGRRITTLEKENAELKADNDARKFAMAMSEKVEKQLREENSELKVKVGLSIDCEKAQKNGELCLGYGGDEDEPCERCKNCIKCECGYYQLGETEKNEQLTKAKELIEDIYNKIPASHSDYYKDVMERARDFLSEVEK